MFDIKKIIMCPKCKADLSDDLKCVKCGKQYYYKHGVYNLISLDLSGEQEYLYRNKIPDDINLIFTKEKELEMDKWIKDYYLHHNEETKSAKKKQNEYMDTLIQSISGNICDLATGGGRMLQKIIDCGNDSISSIVCIDINELELMTTRIRRKSDRNNISYIVTDGRYLSLKDKCFDYIVSLSGFGNIPETNKVAKEIFRVLKPGGKIIIQGEYIEKNTKSYELALKAGVERGVVEEYIIQDLKNAGFENIKSTVAAEAIWAENPYDLIPAAGDTQRFCIIEAQRTDLR